MPAASARFSASSLSASKHATRCSGSFAAAFGYNPLIYAMPYVFCYVFFPMEGRIHRRILTVIGIAGLINWVYRIICVTI